MQRKMTTIVNMHNIPRRHCESKGDWLRKVPVPVTECNRSPAPISSPLMGEE